MFLVLSIATIDVVGAAVSVDSRSLLTPDTMTSLEPLATDYLLGFDAWDALRLAGARSVWDHIDETERGVHGRFAQRIIAAWHAADSGNQRALYEAFPHIFNAR